MTRVAVITLGCKTNQYESAALQEALGKQGHCLAGSTQAADVYVVNTCTVTAYTDFQCRQAVRRAQRANPDATIIVAGCYVQAYPEALGQLPGIDYLVGNNFKARIPDLIKAGDKRNPPECFLDNIAQIQCFEDLELSSFPGRTRALLKVQDGCDSFCTYCIVPYARGRSRSLPANQVVKKVKGLAANGFREVVLTGIHLGDYGRSDGNGDLAGLVKKIEAEASEIRIRLSSVEPNEVTPELINLLAGGKGVCPHLHLPLQSGDDDILKRMGRQYTRADFAAVVNELAETIPEVCLGADVMAGFPGETDGQFENSYRLIEKLPLSYLHVFPYSRRPGTVAAGFRDQIDPRITKKRSQAIQELAAHKKRDFFSRFLGKSVPVLVEGKRDRATGKLKGISPNYLPVIFEGPDDLMNQEIEVALGKIEGQRIVGKAL